MLDKAVLHPRLSSASIAVVTSGCALMTGSVVDTTAIMRMRSSGVTIKEDASSDARVGVENGQLGSVRSNNSPGSIDRARL